jgi:hypothetical protein
MSVRGRFRIRLSAAKKSDAFFRKARSSYKSEFFAQPQQLPALRLTRVPSPAAAVARKSCTQRPNVDSWMPSSRATVAIDRRPCDRC